MTSITLALITLLISTAVAVNPYYFSTPGLTINSDSCSASYCKACLPGFFNLNCGGASNGTCTACPATPANSYYAAWGASPDGIGTVMPILCPFNCTSNAYVQSASACTAGVCPVSFTVANSQYITGVTYPSCTTECKPGYYGSITNPTSCTACSPGTWSARGSIGCTQCALGKYQDLSAETGCKDCVGPTGYAANLGQSACTPCANCTTGYYRSGCGGSLAGSCPQCSVLNAIV